MLMLVFSLFVFFFFQAEDGIRDHCVTGVQTCALPISRIVAGAKRIPTATRRRAAWRTGAGTRAIGHAESPASSAAWTAAVPARQCDGLPPAACRLRKLPRASKTFGTAARW